jgi:hypothetical protein
MIAMTVGAHKIRLMAEKEVPLSSQSEAAEPNKTQESECST